MSKLIRVINKIIENQDKILKVFKYQKELFFEYKNYYWSLDKTDDEQYKLFHYPNYSDDLEHLFNRNYGNHWENVSMVTYNSEELSQNEALQSFEELYRILDDKIFGIDKVFDDILNDDN